MCIPMDIKIILTWLRNIMWGHFIFHIAEPCVQAISQFKIKVTSQYVSKIKVKSFNLLFKKSLTGNTTTILTYKCFLKNESMKIANSLIKQAVLYWGSHNSMRYIFSLASRNLSPLHKRAVNRVRMWWSALFLKHWLVLATFPPFLLPSSISPSENIPVLVTSQRLTYLGITY